MSRKKDEPQDETEPQPKQKPKRQTKQKIVLPPREKSTRVRKAPEKLDL